MDDVTSRELICGTLPALKDNRAEAEQRLAEFVGADNGAPAATYQPGLYVMMDWVAARLRTAGSAAWALILGSQDFEALSAIELECVFAVDFETVSTFAACLT